MSTKFLRIASISKKATMGVAGLFLSLFLLVHLGLNLLLLRPDGGEWFRVASHFMGSNYVVKIIEIVLILSFIIHILIGIILWFQNQFARPKRYYRTNRSDTAFMSKYMIHTGVIIFMFLIIHFMNFYFVKLGIVASPEGIDSHDFYTMAQMLFSNVYYSAIYIIALIVLGVHLNHALQSAFQTFGLHHNKYYVALTRLSLIYAVFISSGFILIPLYYLFIF